MDYEIGFKIMVSILLGWFAVDKKNTRDDIKKLQEESAGHGTAVAVLNEKMNSVKEDTKYIRGKLEDK